MYSAVSSTVARDPTRNVSRPQVGSRPLGWEPLFYTGGSKIDARVGAVFCGPQSASFRLPDYCSVFSAELYAILQAIRHLKRYQVNSAVICSDSQAAIRAISQTHAVTNHLAGHIQVLYR